MGPAFPVAPGSCGTRYVSESDEGCLQEGEGMELGIQLATPGLCFVLKKCRFPRRQRGHGKQTFQAKGIAWAKPFFLSIAYNIGSILVILNFHCVNNEFEEQKVGGRIGTRTFCSPFRLQFCS